MPDDWLLRSGCNLTNQLANLARSLSYFGKDSAHLGGNLDARL